LQPAYAEEAYCGVIFDGLLYNCEELSDRFAGSPEPIANEAALILRAYLCWGEEVLHKIKGIFALIIWDRKRDVLLCARDPLGLYPLFYAEAGHELLLSRFRCGQSGCAG
jgi:asparagine synthase (glutamine-hydrolysing)